MCSSDLVEREARHDFGTNFPLNPGRGDTCLRVDSLPNRLYKFNGSDWMEIKKDSTDIYAYDEEYIKYLINQLNSGAYDPSDLSAAEEDQIKEYLKKNS